VEWFSFTTSQLFLMFLNRFLSQPSSPNLSHPFLLPTPLGRETFMISYQHYLTVGRYSSISLPQVNLPQKVICYLIISNLKLYRYRENIL
jgi:hypothetical protein